MTQGMVTMGNSPRNQSPERHNKAQPVPENSTVQPWPRMWPQSQRTMAVYLSAGDPEGVQAALLAGGYPAHTAVAVAHRLGWPGERLFWATLADLPDRVRQAKADRQTIFLVLPGLDRDGVSKLYDPAFAHGFRPCREQG